MPGQTVTAWIYTTVISSPLDGLFENCASMYGSDGTNIVNAETACTAVSAPTALPSTGYAPVKDGQSSVLPLLPLIGGAVLTLLAAVMMIGFWFKRAQAG